VELSAYQRQPRQLKHRRQLKHDRQHSEAVWTPLFRFFTSRAKIFFSLVLTWFIAVSFFKKVVGSRRCTREPPGFARAVSVTET
jgi:hypothetical protein